MSKILKYITVLFVSISLSFVSIDANAQCPMCKMSAEQNLKMGGSAGKGLNKGILFMFAMPYLIVGTLGIVWYRNRRKEDETQVEQ